MEFTWHWHDIQNGLARLKGHTSTSEKHTIYTHNTVIFHACAVILKSWNHNCNINRGSCSRDRHLTIPETTYTALRQQGSTVLCGGVSWHRGVWQQMQAALLAVKGNWHELPELLRSYLRLSVAHIVCRAPQRQVTLPWFVSFCFYQANTEADFE